MSLWLSSTSLKHRQTGHNRPPVHANFPGPLPLASNRCLAETKRDLYPAVGEVRLWMMMMGIKANVVLLNKIYFNFVLSIFMLSIHFVINRFEFQTVTNAVQMTRNIDDVCSLYFRFSGSAKLLPGKCACGAFMGINNYFEQNHYCKKSMNADRLFLGHNLNY